MYALSCSTSVQLQAQSVHCLSNHFENKFVEAGSWNQGLNPLEDMACWSNEKGEEINSLIPILSSKVTILLFYQFYLVITEHWEFLIQFFKYSVGEKGANKLFNHRN